MEFRADRDDLAEAVAWTARTLPTRSPVPVLGGLLLEAGPQRLGISGFDFETAARIEIDVETGAGGRILVLGRRLLDICRVLPPGQVSCWDPGGGRCSAGPEPKRAMRTGICSCP